ncbi:hypothetical protein [Mesorhizobium sp.]|uniref:hypothetical protein n=1 Tax=Mesorhizobium sp. TaxID=1871066 RepID=UPI00338FB57C
MAITVTVRRRVTEDRVSVSIRSYGFPHSIIDHTTVKKGQQIELTGEVTRMDEEGGRVTVDLGPLVTVDAKAKKAATGHGGLNTLRTSVIAYLRPPPTSVSLFVRRTPIRLAGALQAIYPNAPHKRRRPPSQPLLRKLASNRDCAARCWPS